MLRRSAMKAALRPDLADAGEVFRYLGKAVEKAGYTVGKDVVYAMMLRRVNYIMKRRECTISRGRMESAGMQRR